MLRLKNIVTNARANIRDNRRIFILYSVLRVLIIVSMIRAVFNGNYNGALYCLLSLLLFMIPSLMENGFKIKFPPILEGAIYLFIFAAEILGEVNHFYVSIPGWDTILHTINGFLAAAVGLSLIDLLNRNSKNINLSPFYLALVAFCFSMTIGVLWEFWEFAADSLFNIDMQKDVLLSGINSVTLDPENVQTVVHIDDIQKTVIYTTDGQTFTINGGYLDIGITDTIKDMFVNFIGAVVFSVLGYFMLKRRNNRSGLVADLMVRPVIDESDESNYALTEGDGFTDGIDQHTGEPV